MTVVSADSAQSRCPAAPRVAIVHDFLVSRGGAERVALTMARAFPEAPIHTALHDADGTFEGFSDHQIRPLLLDRFRVFRHHHRLSLPLLQAAFSRRVIDADVVLCSSSGFAHNVSTTGRKVVYCHTPARWLHDQERYLDRFGPAARTSAKLLTRGAHRRDVRAMLGADRILANSRTIGDHISAVYGRKAEVVAPCSSLALDDTITPIEGVTPGFVLCPSRALGYKRLDVLAAAASRVPSIQFVQVGDGPDLARLQRGSPPNLRFLGEVSDAELRWAYSNASVVVLTSAEDFGLVPVEATAHGLMSIVPEARGLLDHVEDGVNGWFYSFGDDESLAELVESKFDTAAVPPVTDPLGERRFTAALHRVVSEVVR
ncbi:MAG: glycosyltransferase family 4 protein [Actinobacteria bacterium]|nr:glycosyltransferase family 4 protein [Actinomycetota bacterium]